MGDLLGLFAFVFFFRYLYDQITFGETNGTGKMVHRTSTPPALKKNKQTRAGRDFLLANRERKCHRYEKQDFLIFFAKPLSVLRESFKSFTTRQLKHVISHVASQFKISPSTLDFFDSVATLGESQLERPGRGKRRLGLFFSPLSWLCLQALRPPTQATSTTPLGGGSIM